MKRKDILIISAIVIVIAFGTVLGIYMAINGNIFAEAIENVKESLKRTHHSNGWETAIVDRIVDGVPVPVGFTYIEGKQKNGLIIENNISKEKYMWIPKTEEVNEEIYEEIMIKCNLGENSQQEVEQITKYDGFYIAIDEMLEGETYEVKTLTEEEKYELRLRNESIGETVETHLTTPEEMAAVLAYNEKIENKIKVTNYKTLTVLAETVGVGKKEESKTEEAATKHETEAAYIPAGFTHVEGTKVSTGFKIEDTNNLRFIWIPVEDASNVKEEIINKMREAGIEEDTITAYENYKDDTESDEYNELKSSIEKYGGFYISEAELGYDENGFMTNKTRITSKKTGYVINGDYYRNVTESNINKKEDGTETSLGAIQRAFNKDGGLTKEKAIEKCKELYGDSETVVSHLGYGLNYDATILYLLENCSKVTEKTAFEDSTSIGKYSDSDQESLWYSENYLNGIYGLAGNLAEITQEEEGENIITVGGSFADAGNVNPIALRSSAKKGELDLDGEGNKSGKIGCRAFLYIKEEREKNANLEEIKKTAKNEIREYIEENGDLSKAVYETIIPYINERIDKATSTRTIDECKNTGILLVDKVVYHIEEINKYKEELTEEKYKTIRENGIKEIESLEMKEYKDGKGYYKDQNGKVVTLQDIVAETKSDIDEESGRLTQEEKNAVLQEFKDTFPIIEGTEYRISIYENIEKDLANTDKKEEIEQIRAKYISILEIINTFAAKDTDPTTWTSHDNTWNYYGSWEEKYLSLKNEGINEIAKTKTVEDAKNKAMEYRIKIADEVDKLKIEAIAENFFWTEPQAAVNNEWKNKEIWETEYGNWKNQEKANIINSATVEEAEGKVTKDMEFINAWIEKKIAIGDIAYNFYYHSEPKSWEGSESWNSEYVQLKEEWKNKIINSIDEADAKSKVPLAWADITEQIPETEGPKEGSQNETDTTSTTTTPSPTQGTSATQINKYVFAGDSRFVGMKEICDDKSKDDYTACKTGEGLSFFKNNESYIKSVDSSNAVLVIGFGVNDMHNISNYINYVNELKLQAKIYYLTVNPVEDEKASKAGYFARNNDVINFNKTLKENAGKYTIIDTYSYLQNNGFITLDGLHYDNATYTKVYNYIKEQISVHTQTAQTRNIVQVSSLAGTNASGIYGGRKINYDAYFAAITQTPEELGLTVKKSYTGARTTTYGPEAFANSGYAGLTCVPGINLTAGMKIAAKPIHSYAKNYNDVKIGDWIYVENYGYFLVSDVGDGPGTFDNVNWFDLFHINGEKGYLYPDYSNIKVLDQAEVEAFIQSGYVIV